jgi:pantoate--beta-alanine ligase
LQVYSRKSDLEGFLSGIRKKRIRIGFVPTMGALHQGHIRLVEKSVENNDYTIVSIYVNHLQFNNKSDFDNYPVPREKDIKMLEAAGCDLAFIPETNDMYPEGYSKVKLELGLLNNVLEGPLRPGHFDGVVQVVYRLFDYIRPDRAYFGLKDYQQCQVIRLLRNAYFPTITLQFCPTSRTESGLAMSSRNERLSAEGKAKAATLYKVLDTIMRLSRHIEAPDALLYGRHMLNEQGIETEYLELAHADTLLSGKKWFRKDKNVVLVAAYIEQVRLIDNIVF